MTGKLQFALVTPECLFLSREVDMVTVPGAEGDFGVLKDHAPFMSAVRPGVIEVTDGGAVTERIFVRGGFAEVTPDGLTVLAERALPMDQLEAAALDQDISDLEEDLAEAQDEAARRRIMDELENLKMMRTAL